MTSKVDMQKEIENFMQDFTLQPRGLHSENCRTCQIISPKEQLLTLITTLRRQDLGEIRKGLPSEASITTKVTGKRKLPDSLTEDALSNDGYNEYRKRTLAYLDSKIKEGGK